MKIDNLKERLPDNLRQYTIFFLAVFAISVVLISGVLTIIYYRILPSVTSLTANTLSDIVFENTLLILGVLVVPALIISWFITRFNVRNTRLKKRLELDEDALALVTDAVYVHDFQGNCVYASKAGVKNDGHHKNKLTNVKNLVFKELIRPRIKELIDNGEMTFESTHSQTDKSSIQVEVHCRVIEAENGNSFLSIIRDITEQRRTEEELQQSYKSLRTAMNGTINSMASLAEAKDPYTAGHQQRVAKLAMAIGKELGLSEEQVEGIRVAGILHDIGKISIPAEILSKPGKLRKSEFDLVKDHSDVGYGLLKVIEFSRPIAQMVLQHHERMDGSGYPNHIAGDAIMKEARIMAVADVIEAMSSHRPYRPALSIEKALLEIIMKKGILYDPEVVEACVRLFNDKGFTFD